MGKVLLEKLELTLEEEIKTLEDEELLDFWEETHFLNSFLEKNSFSLNQNYESIILQELQLRTCKKMLANHK
ncbi:MAG: hypothetical protein Q9M37_02935 [Desulfonauticus sp.]|nr:hypothetical protein [Desulfonauticus sp.]